MFRKWIVFDAMGVIFKVGDNTGQLLVPYVQKIGAADCVFVDDRDKNLIPARDLGMHVIRFIRDGSSCCLDGVPVARCFSDVLTVAQNIW